MYGYIDHGGICNLGEQCDATATRGHKVAIDVEVGEQHVIDLGAIIQPIAGVLPIGAAEELANTRQDPLGVLIRVVGSRLRCRDSRRLLVGLRSRVEFRSWRFVRDRRALMGNDRHHRDGNATTKC